MSRVRSQIQHDYKTLVKPRPAAGRKKAHIWFWIGALAPLAIVVWLLVGNSNAHSTATAPLLLAAVNPPSQSPHAAGDDTTMAVPVALAADATPAAARSRQLPIPALRMPAPAALDVPADDPYTSLTLTIRKGDTLDQLFKKHGLSRSDLARILTLSDAKSALARLLPGDEVRVRHDNGSIVSVSRKLDEVRTLNVALVNDKFTASIAELPVEVRVSHASATIDSSLFLAAKAAGVSDNLIMNLAGIFAWDIDFVLDIRAGDRFSVIYEQIWQDGKYLRDGDILAAHFVNRGDVFQALRYADPQGDVGYYTPAGMNVKKAFLRAPIAISPRVTSRFNPRRRHPVHNSVRPHRGVDYGGPRGTPIKAAGDGKVIFRGRKGGYGNAVILQHGSNITTLYAHMSKFAGRARNGARVKQGQVIGYVGSTGTATGPHLHYEYRVNGVHRNPRTVALPKAQPIPKKYVADFEAATAPLLNQLNIVSQIQRVAAAD